MNRAVSDIEVPDNHQAVVSQLSAVFEELPPQLQIAARFIIDHPREVSVQTMRSLATEAGVHPNSFVRLARFIGFDGYESMRERFRDFVRQGSGSTTDRVRWLQNLARKGGKAEIMSQMASAVLANHEQLFSALDMKQVEKAVSWMLKADRVFVLGVGVGYAMAYQFWYVARMMHDNFILIPRHGSLPMDDLLGIRKTDLLLAMTFQPYRNDVIEAVRFAQKRKARTIGLSDSPAATLYRESDIGLSCPTHTPQFFQSNASVIALLEMICAMLAAEGGDKVEQQIEEFNEIRWQSGVYES